MRHFKFFFIIVLLISFNATGQKADKKLAAQLKETIAGFYGDVGIYVIDLKKDHIVAINEDTVFPTASIVKIPILIGILHKLFTGELSYHQRLTYTDSLYFKEGDDILSNFKSGSTIELGKVMLLMLSISDNCASLWLQGLAGGGATINHILDSLGFADTRVNSRTPGREAFHEEYGWGQTTPKDIALIMKAVVDGKIFNKETSDKMLRLMSRQWWDEEAMSSVPAGVFIADKNGALDSNRNEVMYVNGRHPYILSVFTKNNKDTSWESNNEAWVLTRKISAVVWQYYNH
ncbi:MAG TPA: serine hydrolase [Chitinophagaceae bacterium]|nr:serine hydrolase [Chitinophagaceae bacterium]